MPRRPTKRERESLAKSDVLRLYREWAASNGHDPDPLASGKRITGNQAMLFYNFLVEQHPEALDFPGEDKWQVIHSWLKQARISD